MNDDSTKQKILHAAGPIFAERGYRGSTIRDICEAADVNLASINYYFGDKKKLYIETVKTARQMRLQEYPSSRPQMDLAPELQLKEFIRLLLNRLVATQNAPWQVKLLGREFMEPSEGCREMIEDFLRPVFKILLMIVNQLVDGKVDQVTLDKIGFSIIGQCLHYRCASEMITMFVGEDEFAAHYSSDQLAEHISAFTLGAIEKLKNDAPSKPQASA
jgi:AcrR family transcriptional regulator